MMHRRSSKFNSVASNKIPADLWGTVEKLENSGVKKNYNEIVLKKN